MRFEPFRIGVALLRPARAQQRAALEHLPRTRGERGEEPKFSRREIEGLAIDARDVRLRIDAQSPDRCGVLRAQCGTGTAQQRAHARGKLLPAEGLLQVIVGTEVEQLRALLRSALAGEHENRRLPGRAYPSADLVARESRQLAVEDHEVGRVFGVTPQRGLAVVRGDNLIALLTEEGRDHADELAIVVDDEDVAQRVADGVPARASGRVNAKTAPPPAASSSQRSPPCPSTTRRAAKRPTPDPGTSSCATPRAYGSKMRARSCGGTPGPSSCTRTMARSSARSMRTAIRVPSGAYFVALCTRPAMTSAVRRLSPRTKSG